MWTYEKALSVVRAYVDAMSDGGGVVMEDKTLERPFGWVFFYNSRAYVQSGNFRDGYLGNAPLIFDRYSGEYHVTGTAHPIEHYIGEYESRSRPR